MSGLTFDLFEGILLFWHLHLNSDIIWKLGGAVHVHILSSDGNILAFVSLKELQISFGSFFYQIYAFVFEWFVLWQCYLHIFQALPNLAFLQVRVTLLNYISHKTCCIWYIFACFNIGVISN